MASKDDKVKERLAAEKDKMRADEEARLAIAAQAALNPAEDAETEKKTKPVEFEMTGKGLIQAYKDAFKNKDKDGYQDGYKDPEDTGVLHFKTEKDAVDFFTKQAEAKQEFLATKMVDGKLQNEHMFSCGDKTLYHGSVDDIRKQLEDKNTPEAKAGLEKFNTMVATLPPEARGEKRAEEAMATKLSPLPSTPKDSAVTQQQQMRADLGAQRQQGLGSGDAKPTTAPATDPSSTAPTPISTEPKF